MPVDSNAEMHPVGNPVADLPCALQPTLFRAIAMPGPLDIPLPHAIGSTASIAIAILPDREYSTMANGQDIEELLFRIPGVCEVSFRSRDPVDGAPVFTWAWTNGANSPQPWRILLPRIPAGQWLHLLFEWDADRGFWDLRINGTSLRKGESTQQAWQIAQPAHRMQSHINHFAIGALTVLPAAPDMPSTHYLHPQYHGSLDSFIGAGEAPLYDLSTDKGDLLYAHPLTAPLDDLIIEGPLDLHRILHHGEWGSTDSSGRSGHGNFVVWFPDVFPADFVAEWQVRLIGDYGLLIVFFAADGMEDDLFSPALRPRDGFFSQYIRSDIRNYHISYHAHTPDDPARAYSNLRKNPGFQLVANGPPGILAGDQSWKHVKLHKAGNRIRMTIDDRLIIDYKDSQLPHGPGRIGFRQMRWTEAQYRNIRVYSLRAPLQ